MFRISFEFTKYVKKICGIKYVLNTIVQVDSVKQQRLVAQCRNCQSFGYMKNYCNKQLHCVKCARIYSTLECNREINQPKFSNSHPLTYQGCIVAKELHKC